MLKKFLAIFLTLTLCIGMGIGSSISYADLDGLTDEDNYSNQQQNPMDDTDIIANAIQQNTGITDEQMAKAGVTLSPVLNAIGTATGILILFGGAAVGFITACDLIYIGAPPFRGLLTSRWQLVSDEALSIVGGGAKPNGGGMNGGMSGGAMGGMNGGMGGMSGGMGGMNGMNGGMGGAMGGNAQGGQQNASSPITMYLKRRMVFIIIFTVATVILTSSILTGVGLNVAGLIVKIINKLNGSVTGVNM